jgi:hypothetical protein
MLDDLPLATKLLIAGEWFRRSRSGEFDFTGRHADKFQQLLNECHDDAARLLGEPKPGDEKIVRLFPRDTALAGETT